MRLFRLSSCFLAVLSFAPSAMAQFGLGKKGAKKAASFQELNEQAKQQAAGGGGAGAAGGGIPGGLAGMEDMMGPLANMYDVWNDAMKDPEVMKQVSAMGEQLTDALGELSQMSPEQLQESMEQAFQMMTDDTMVDSVVGKKDEVLESLKETGLVPPEELEKYQKDPKYFELKMRESFDQMQTIFKDPEMLKMASETMTGLTKGLGMGSGGGMGGYMDELNNALLSELSTDEQIEDARVQLLGDPTLAGNPALAAMFQTDEMKDILNDPKKWKESVLKGQGMLKQELKRPAAAAGKEGAGVGEL